ncbi:PREDICTED: odorant receptor 33b-like [Dufourea novaeangliae]|uniref:odorant receptor 33b-like n=1 Tax=Dufourea novaeangliae TaxID=178035 RepID=UPI0007670F4E|nr:PREDICTED: odorant receptor 33b-like [Dufourea novaeangliae]
MPWPMDGAGTCAKQKLRQSMYRNCSPFLGQSCVHIRSVYYHERIRMATTDGDNRGDDWMHSVRINRWLLKPIGVWPVSLCVDTMEKMITVLLVLISASLIGFLLVPCALCTILDKTDDLDMKIKMIGPLSFCVMAAIKYCILVSRGGQISKCIRIIRSDWTRTNMDELVGNKEIMIEYANIGRSLAIFCAGFMYSGGFFYTAVMPLCTKRTEIIDNVTVRSQAFPIYRGLLDPRTSPSFEIVQLTQCLAGFVIYSVTVGACSLAAVFVMHACGQFRILGMKLDRLVNCSMGRADRKVTEQCLGDIVQHHLRILGFITQVEELLNEICFVEFVGCTLNICFLGYYLLTEWEQSDPIGALTYCTLLISFTFNIFILCYIGEILSEECKKIGLTAYMINWYRLPGKEALDLILIFAVSNSSRKLTAGKLVELSLGSFCSVLKSSLAYLSLLRTLTT